VNCVARVVCAAYWFHPLIWIAWRRLALEVERACDDAVLGRSEAAAYAGQLVGLAERPQSAAEPPLPCVCKGLRHCLQGSRQEADHYVLLTSTGRQFVVSADQALESCITVGWNLVATLPNGPRKLLAFGEDWCGDVYRELPTDGLLSPLPTAEPSPPKPIPAIWRYSHADFQNLVMGSVLLSRIRDSQPRPNRGRSPRS
jgi:hypothetical protein